MQKRSLVKLFTPGTQNHHIVKLILDCEYIYNYQMPKIGILNYTRRISEIRIELRKEGFDIIAERIENTGTYIYKIVKVKI